MKMIFRYTVFVLPCLLLTGCAGYLAHEKAVAERVLTRRYYSGDLTSHDEVGKLRLKLRSPTKDQIKMMYVVSLDDHGSEVFPWNSDIDFELDPGPHRLSIHARPEGMQWLYGEQFGKEIAYDFNIARNHMLILEYTGPFTVLSAGEIKEQW